MAHRMLRDLEADGWERSDFPILCETCLGPNPYVRMTKEEYGMECKICGRPFTLFRWRPGADARFKKTEICQTCSKAKNVCQTCLLDLEYNLPVQVRDQALGIDGTKQLPRSNVNKEFHMEQLDAKQAAGEDFESSYGKMRANDLLTKLQRTTPYYKRNRARICSFFVRGECSRGAECPFRHEMPETGELSDQNIKDRYYGINDPVAEKMLKKASEMPALKPPADPTITTLYIGGLDPRIEQQDLKDVFYGYGEIDEIKIVSHKNCAFITYKTRSDAEKAASELNNKLIVKGLRLKLLWGRSNPNRSFSSGAPGQGYRPGMMPPMMPGIPPPFGPPQMQQYVPGAAPSPYPAAVYPSMDPNSRGGRR